MSGSSGWRLSRQLEVLVSELRLDALSLGMVALYRRDMWDRHGVFHIAQMSVAMKVPILVASEQFTLKLMPLHSPQDMGSQLKELSSTVPIAPVEIVQSSSLIVVSFESSTIHHIGTSNRSGSWLLPG